jgi:hypothetical protein
LAQLSSQVQKIVTGAERIPRAALLRYDSHMCVEAEVSRNIGSLI